MRLHNSLPRDGLREEQTTFYDGPGTSRRSTSRESNGRKLLALSEREKIKVMSPRVARADFKRGINYGDAPEVSRARLSPNAMRHTRDFWGVLALKLERVTFATSVPRVGENHYRYTWKVPVSCENSGALSLSLRRSDFFQRINRTNVSVIFRLLFSILITGKGLSRLVVEPCSGI